MNIGGKKVKERFFVDCICDKIINDNQVILANKINGEWLKIPIECYKIIEYSVKNKISLDKLDYAFNIDDDKKYYKRVIDKLEQLGFIRNLILEEFKLNKVNLVSFSPTNRCNLRCDYCCVDSKIENKDHLDTDEVKKAIDNIVKINPRTLTITGGEPLLREDFFEILSYVKEKFKGEIILSTNATLIEYSKVDEIIKDLYAIEISLDGYDELSCSKIRGEGVFTKVINLVKYIKSKGFDNIGLSMVVGKNNENNIDKFNKLNQELGTAPIIRNFMNIGRGNENSSRYLNDELDIGYICKGDYTDKNNLTANMCKAGVNQMSIDSKGDVYPCPNLEYDDLKMFNILQFEESILETIFSRDMDVFDKFDNLKTVNIEKCKDCKVNVFCTTCPSKVYTLKNDEEMFNSNCKKMKSILEHIIW